MDGGLKSANDSSLWADVIYGIVEEAAEAEYY